MVVRLKNSLVMHIQIEKAKKNPDHALIRDLSLTAARLELEIAQDELKDGNISEAKINAYSAFSLLEDACHRETRI